MFSGCPAPAGRPSVVSVSAVVNAFHVTRSLYIVKRLIFHEIWHRYLSCEWALLGMFSRSEVKDQDHSESTLRPTCYCIFMGSSAVSAPGA